MDKSKKAIISLLQTHQPMSLVNLLRIVSNESGKMPAVQQACKELIDENKITYHANGMVMLSKK